MDKKMEVEALCTCVEMPHIHNISWVVVEWMSSKDDSSRFEEGQEVKNDNGVTRGIAQESRASDCFSPVRKWEVLNNSINSLMIRSTEAHLSDSAGSPWV